MKVDVNKIFDIAHKAASKSDCKYKISCVLVDERGKVVSIGFNHWSNGNKMGKRTVHAEKDALDKVTKPAPNLYAFIYRLGSKPINPCEACSVLLKSYGIKSVYCITENGWAKEE